MMQSDRAKPRVTHVRTGCLTCKRRRVKCPEERPSCSRCTRAGFVCAGYAVPKTWLFEGSAGSQPKATDAEPRPEPVVDSQNPIHTSDYPTPAASPGHAPRLAIPLPATTSLQAGNSDPFDSYAIPIGPRESYLIQFYRSDVIPEFYVLESRSWLQSIANDDWANSLRCLKDEATAYSLLARNAALESIKTRGPGAPTSTSVLDYMAKAQAALYKRLPLLDGSETPATVWTIMWATCHLAATELLIGSPTPDVHLRPLCNLVVRYVELLGKDLDAGLIIHIVYTDIARALMHPSRPMLDMFEWFPRVFGASWETAASMWHKSCDPGLPVHSDVQDVTTASHILNLRLSLNAVAGLVGVTLNVDDARNVAVAHASRNLFRHGQLLNVAMDAIDDLDRHNLTSKQIEEHSARASISLATVLWSHRISAPTLGGRLLYDAAPGILPLIKTTITKGLAGRRTQGSRSEPYMDAQLWVLYLGAQTECFRSEVLGLNKVCGDWFLETFHKHASLMRVETWQDAVYIFEQFLHSDHLVPHISQLWRQAPQYTMPIR